MLEPRVGDYVICNDLLGVVVDTSPKQVVLKSLDGEHTCNITENTVVFATAAEMAKRSALQLKEMMRRC